MERASTAVTVYSNPGNLALFAEFATLFVALPLAFRFRLVPVPPIPALWLRMFTVGLGDFFCKGAR